QSLIFVGVFTFIEMIVAYKRQNTRQTLFSFFKRNILCFIVIYSFLFFNFIILIIFEVNYYRFSKGNHDFFNSFIEKLCYSVFFNVLTIYIYCTWCVYPE
ncbi:MAG: hypothetical protein KC414_14655, partial [Romboutsia sp.]|nr:hypothetical protein [Romboutsia sp.]